jgi:ATP-binding cassette subfamily B protein
MSCRARYLWGCLFLLGANAFALLIPWLLKLAVESLKNPVAVHSPAYYAAWIIRAALAHGIVRVYSGPILHAGRHIGMRSGRSLWKARLPGSAIFLRRRTGDILSLFQRPDQCADAARLRRHDVVNTAILYVAAIALMLRISRS